MNGFVPGQKCPKSGQYMLIDEFGFRTGREVTVVYGEPFPPTPRPRMSYVLVDATRHGRY